MSQETIASNIKVLRKEARLSMEELSEKTGITVERLNELESGKDTPRTLELEALCPALHINEEDFLERDLYTERQESMKKLKGSTKRKDFNWYLGDKNIVLFYILELVIIPAVFILSIFLCKYLKNIFSITIGEGEDEVEVSIEIINFYFNFLIPYSITSIVSDIFIIIELVRRNLIHFQIWFIFIIGFILSIGFIAGLIAVIPYYIFSIVQLFTKKGKNR